MTRRSASCAVKKEMVNDNEEFDGNTDTKPALRRGSAAATASAAASRSSPVLTSRFFPSPSSCPARGRKRKSADGGCGSGGASGVKSGLGQAPTVKKEPTEESGRGEGRARARGGWTGGGSRSGQAQAQIPDGLGIASTPSAAAAGARRSSRFNAVKEEVLAEELELPRHLLAAAGAATAFERGDGRDTTPMRMAAGRLGAKQETDIKREGKGKKAATIVKQEGGGKRTSKRAKIEAQAEKEPQVEEEKPVPPRLAEKAALIAQVMDKLYPDPPIPINHLVRSEKRVRSPLTRNAPAPSPLLT